MHMDASQIANMLWIDAARLEIRPSRCVARMRLALKVECDAKLVPALV